MPFHVPLIIRGQRIEGGSVEFAGRHAGMRYTTPDVKSRLAQLPLASPAQMRDQYALRFEEVLDYLHALGQELSFAHNRHLQEACELSVLTSGLGRDALRHFYSSLSALFEREFVRELAENAIGTCYLDDWVQRRLQSGCLCNIRAFGARALHVLAGNVPIPSAMGVIRNAITRSDAVFKTPSNDPMTAAAIAQTMIDMAPDHPLTRHLSVAHWKGGDTAVEEFLYRPEHFEKIIAWGGQASIRHISRYIQPGIDLISMDPKLSSAIIGRDAFATDETMKEAAGRLAIDIGYFNQQACANARVAYVHTGTDPAGLERANRFGRLVYEAIQALPPAASAAADRMSPELLEEVRSLALASELHQVVGGGLEGAVIVSQTDEPVDFAPLLNDRVANVVPVADLEVAIQSVTAYTQTIGVYPEAVKTTIRDRLVLNGAQRVVSLGYACKAAMAGPHDGMEPLRRMCKWVTDETNDPAVVPLPASASRSV
jgi:Acyl-CoA reductase (LuxC)